LQTAIDEEIRDIKDKEQDDAIKEIRNETQDVAIAITTMNVTVNQIATMVPQVIDLFNAKVVGMDVHLKGMETKLNADMYYVNNTVEAIKDNVVGIQQEVNKVLKLSETIAIIQGQLNALIGLYGTM
jgi:Mg2+ and Co2+ transporter CorA